LSDLPALGLLASLGACGLLAACEADPPVAQEQATQHEVAQAAPHAAPPASPAASPAESPAAPAGNIGGEPILPNPIVLGGISTEAVQSTIAEQRAGIDGCYADALKSNPGLAGKVLVRFSIDSAGGVTRSSIKSTSLRHSGAETCVQERLAAVRFPRLDRGEKAIITFPFVFPPQA